LCVCLWLSLVFVCVRMRVCAFVRDCMIMMIALFL